MPDCASVGVATLTQVKPGPGTPAAPVAPGALVADPWLAASLGFALRGHPVPRRPYYLHDRADRARAYELILREGSPHDLLDYIASRGAGGRPAAATSAPALQLEPIRQLHQQLLELIPGGAKKDLSAAQAKALLAKVRLRDVVGQDPPPGRSRADQRPGTDLRPQEGRQGGLGRPGRSRRPGGHAADRA